MSLVSTPSLGSIFVPHTTPRNQRESILCSSESPTSQASCSAFETCEPSHKACVSARSSSGDNGSILDFPTVRAADSSQDITFSSPLSLALNNPVTLSWSLTWEFEQGLVDDAGEPELPDESFVYSAEVARAEKERRRLLWSNPQASKILKRQGFIPPPTPPPETCSARLRGSISDKDDKVATPHIMVKRSQVTFRDNWL